MATCKNCGAELKDNAKFCPDCGTPTEEAAAEEQQEAVQTFTFKKGKMLGTVTYQRTNTTVTVYPAKLEMHKTVKKIFRREKEEDRSVPLTAIRSVRIHTVLDFWDTLYAAVFAVLGFFQPVLFLGAAVCLWSGYGKEIEILTTGGSNLKIPLAAAREDAEKLMGILNHP